MLPVREHLTICIAHPAYQLKSRLDVAHPGFNVVEVRNAADFKQRVAEADVVVVSGLWSNDLLDGAPRLKLIQSVSAGVDQFDQAALRAKGVRLASAQGVNARAVAHHAMALILALVRRLPEARDNQKRRHWRPMMGNFADREDELTGKTLLVVGLGGIGGRLARLAKAFEMTVIGVRQDPAKGAEGADCVHGLADLPELLPRADFAALTCPLTADTTGLMDAAAFGRMKASACLVNVARGGCVVEGDLIAALQSGRIAGAALDVVAEEPLPASSPLWTVPGVFITSHLGGETRSYEDNVVEVLMENLNRLWRGDTALRNQVV